MCLRHFRWGPRAGGSGAVGRRPADVRAWAILCRRHHGESDLINSLVTPCTHTLRRAVTVTTPRDEIDNDDDPDLLRARNAVQFSVSEHLSPHKIVNFHHTSLIASDLGHIAHRFRRFHGGGPNRFSPTIDARNYSENSRGIRTFAGVRRTQSEGRLVLRRICTSIATMLPSRCPNCTRK